VGRIVVLCIPLKIKKLSTQTRKAGHCCETGIL